MTARRLRLRGRGIGGLTSRLRVQREFVVRTLLEPVSTIFPAGDGEPLAASGVTHDIVGDPGDVLRQHR